MANDIEWPISRPTTARRQSCAVCGLRAEALVCAMCMLRPKTSIAWLERLPQGERVTKALEVLRGMG